VPFGLDLGVELPVALMASRRTKRKGKGRERVPWGNDGENWQLVTDEPVEFEE
jgi:hypothetical protein